MSEVKFTKGPWATSYREDKGGMFNQDVYDSAGESVCTCSWYAVDNGIAEVNGKTYRSTTTNREHNADLIAAAPEMYAMLEVCLSEMHSLIDEVNDQRASRITSTTENEPDYHDQETLQLIQLLLAKARGEHV